MSDQTSTITDLPEIIRGEADACAFCFWLSEHPEIKAVQGHEVLRGERGHFYGLRIDSQNIISTDIHELMAERKTLNDWIRTYRQRHQEVTR